MYLTIDTSLSSDGVKELYLSQWIRCILECMSFSSEWMPEEILSVGLFALLVHGQNTEGERSVEIDSMNQCDLSQIRSGAKSPD